MLYCKANDVWDFWLTNTPVYDAYIKEVQFFKTLNITWIFNWEYRYQNYLPKSFPLSAVRIYKIKWQNEYKFKLCEKENVEYFCKTKTKKYALHDLQTFDKREDSAPRLSAPAKMEIYSSFKNSQTKGLT